MTTMTSTQTAASPAEMSRPVRVLLIEHDPISRHVIQQYLTAAAGIQLAGSLDRCGPDTESQLDGVDIAVICGGSTPCCGSTEGLLVTVIPLLAEGIGVLLLGTQWSRDLIERLIAVGATGFLLKQPGAEGLSAGILAVSAGQSVISPGLLQSYWGRRPARVATGRTGRHRLTVREREVLDLLAQGVTTREAALTLPVSSATIKSHVSHSLTKLGARSRLEAVLLMQGA